MHALIKLSRWQEYIPFTLPLTLLGGLMAVRFGDDVSLDWRLLAVLLGNCLGVAYAFIVNDIEDADDDMHNPERGARNAIATGEISKSMGWMIGLVTAGLALVFYGLAGIEAFVVGIVVVILSHLYSWKPVRLKALPIVDIVSHVLFLSALLMIAPYVVYDASPQEVLLLAFSMAMFSAYGQLYNQTRDYEPDRAAGLKNTASILGKKATEIASYLSIVGAAGGLLITIVLGAFPLWLLGVLVAALPIGWYFGRGRDMRGDEATDAVGDAQVQFLIVVNIILLVWLAAELWG